MGNSRTLCAKCRLRRKKYKEEELSSQILQLSKQNDTLSILVTATSNRKKKSRETAKRKSKLAP